MEPEDLLIEIDNRIRDLLYLAPTPDYRRMTERLKSDATKVWLSYKEGKISKEEAVKKLSSIVETLARTIARIVRQEMREGKRCPEGEEYVGLNWIAQGLAGDRVAKTNLGNYVIRNYWLLERLLRLEHYERERNPIVLADKLLMYFKLRNPTLADKLREVSRNFEALEELRYYAWCPNTNQFFKIRARYVKGEYKESLSAIVRPSQIIKEIEKYTEKRTAAPQQMQIIRPTSRVWAVVSGAPPKNELLAAIGMKCPICGTPVTTMKYMEVMVMGYQRAATLWCPTCKTTYWAIHGPTGVILGANPPIGWEKTWPEDWKLRLEELRDKGFVIGPIRPF